VPWIRGQAIRRRGGSRSRDRSRSMRLWAGSGDGDSSRRYSLWSPMYRATASGTR
jgi:hypothetical protein